MWITATRNAAYQEHSQDRLVVVPGPGGVVLAVADGAGGQSGGTAAAEKAVRLVELMASTRNAAIWGEPEWLGLLGSLDTWLLDDPDAGETTLVALCLSEDTLTGAGVGDSGAWIITPSGLVDLTEDQQPRPFLGSGAAFPVGFSYPFRQGDTLLLATDGLLKYADPESLADLARGADLEAAADALVERVRLRSGNLPDDVALVLCRRAPECP